jgi:hypothetical protein
MSLVAKRTVSSWCLLIFVTTVMGQLEIGNLDANEREKFKCEYFHLIIFQKNTIKFLIYIISDKSMNFCRNCIYKTITHKIPSNNQS